MAVTPAEFAAPSAVLRTVSPELPFQSALGEALDRLAPGVQQHVLQPPGTTVIYRGTMRVWRDGGWRGRIAGWLLRAGTLFKMMFPETAPEVPFEMKHVVEAHDKDASLTMSWIRTFHFARGARRFDALMRFHPDQGPVVLWSGCRGMVEVELCPRVDDDAAIVVTSRREWLRLGFIRIPIPGFLKGRPHVREAEEPDGSLTIRVEITNTLLGQFFGYEGRYRRVEDCPGD